MDDYERIYLQPKCCVDPESDHGRLWSQDPVDCDDSHCPCEKDGISPEFVSVEFIKRAADEEKKEWSGDYRIAARTAINGLLARIGGINTEESKWQISNYHTRQLIIFSFLYAVGRRSFASSTMSKIIIDNWCNLFDHDKALVEREIKNAMENRRAGDETDIKEWEKVFMIARIN